MKEKDRYHQKMPVMGNRSKSVFGISVLMHQDFFSKCSSIGGRNRTPQPICKEFARHYKLQLEIRDMMTEAMIRRMGYTKEDCLREWQEIVCKCTKTATDAFIEKYGPIPPGRCVMPSKKAEAALQYAAKNAIAEMRKLSELRMNGIGCVTHASMVLEFKPMRYKRAVPLSLRESVLRENPRCVRCGVTADESVLHVDHILPLAKGGSNDPGNLQVLCRECNLGKGSKPETATGIV
jgi:5-methylcytosine-specific restriction protein A